MKSENKNFILFLIESLLISSVSACLIWLQTSKYGIGLTPDSTTYLRWADTISKEGQAFILNNPSATFPPFYPLLLSFVSTLFNTDSLVVARYFNIVLVFIFSFLSLLLCRKLTKNLVFLFVFGLFIVFSKPTNLVFSFAWSEPLFIFILALITFAVEKTTYKQLILCGLFTSLAILTRYAGVAIVPSVCLYIFIQKIEISEKIKKCFCYTTIPSLSYVLYITRNYYFTGTLMGSRASSNTGLISNFDRAVSTVTFWFSASFSFLAIILALFCGAFLWNYRHELKKYVFDSPQIIKFSACFFLIYFIFITVTSTTTAYDLIDNRLMSPVFLSMFLLIAYFTVFCFNLQSNNKILKYGIIAILIICFILSFVKTTFKDVNSRKNNGAGGYASALWQENKLLNYLTKHRDILSGVVYTNDIYSFFLIDRMLKPQSMPLKKVRNSTDFTGVTLENLPIKLPDFENSYLAYFNDSNILESFTLVELRSICHMETMVETTEGSLFKVGECDKSTINDKKHE